MESRQGTTCPRHESIPVFLERLLTLCLSLQCRVSVERVLCITRRDGWNVPLSLRGNIRRGRSVKSTFADDRG